MGPMLLRFHPDNLDAHCYSCHRRFEENPQLHTDWKLKNTASQMILAMEISFPQPHKWKAHELEEVWNHYIGEDRKMLLKRSSGFQGRIEFIAYEPKADMATP